MSVVRNLQINIYKSIFIYTKSKEKRKRLIFKNSSPQYLLRFFFYLQLVTTASKKNSNTIDYNNIKTEA